MKATITLQVFYEAHDDDDAWHLARIMRNRLDELTPHSTVVRIARLDPSLDFSAMQPPDAEAREWMDAPMGPLPEDKAPS